MSTLVQDILENNSSLEQSFKIYRKTNLAHVRPWIYVQGTLLDGDLQLEILDGATVLVTETISYTDINAAKQNTYAHGWIRFDFDSLQLNIPEGSIEKEYVARLTMINHTNDPSNFVAWNREWDFKKYENYGDVDGLGDPINDMIAPFGLEFYAWESK